MTNPGETAAAARTYERLVQEFARVERVAAEEPYETKPGEFGVENWRAIAARNALQRHIAVLRGPWGAKWLGEQPVSVRDRVDLMERELNAIKGAAILDGAVALPVDLPEDPFSG